MSINNFSIPLEVFDPDQLSTALKESKSPVVPLKEQIKKTTEFLHTKFHQNTYIRHLIWARATFIDQLLHVIWDTYDWGQETNICLVAVGGYGRGELHPHSDIDLLVLLKDEESLEKHQKNISDFITTLWDTKLDIGHSVRTVSQTLTEAEREITIVTNLMESRVLIGNKELHEALISDIDTSKIWSSQRFFRAKWDEQIDRHQKHGNSEYKLEANIKNSPGGLRDIQMIGWITKRHFDADHIEELVGKGFIKEEELDILNRGLDFLWRVRYALHMISGREEDRLLFDHQRTLAEMFGYEDDDAKMAVEQFMQYYYRWALSLGELNDVLMQHFDETILRACEAETIYEINSRFRIRNGHIEVTNDKVFENTPYALLEVFVLSAHNKSIDGVRASTIRLIRGNRDLIDEDFRNDPRNQRLFMELLTSKNQIALNLRRMLRFGVLGKYLPEFGKIIGQMQHDLFHIYSVDAHTMELIKNLRRFHYADFQKKFPVASRVVRRLPKVELLYIAGLYHDIAKGRGGNHSKLGVVDARLFCELHDISKRDTNLVCWLVENHLLMSAVAQRSDISDPEIIGDFAVVVGDQDHLDYLYALTVADINATNPTLWNNWRASLLRQLYSETKRALRRGIENPIDKADWIAENQANAIEKLQDLGFTEDEIHKIWTNTAEDYFLREKVDDIVWHTEAITHHTDPDNPLILVRETSNIDVEGATQIFIHARHQENMFAVMASGLEQLDLNIQDARIYNSGTGLTLDTFFVLDGNGESIGDDPERIAEIKQLLAEMLKEAAQSLDIISRRTPRQMRLFSIPTRTTFFTDTSRGYSVLEVITPDRPGLLARIGKIFVDYGIELQNAKIATLGERVEDVFFITSKQQPIEDPKLCEAIQTAICKELDEQAAS
ncbi:MAG: [protein-PII] uridylyltransferase [Oceanicoccus sp.]|jgi:[protein-PII] uridylyltransferase